MTYIIGIDEAGRGPFAGPVAIGMLKIPKGFNMKFFKGIKDSKKLTEKDREIWFDLAQKAKKNDELDFCVALISEKIIDAKGITYAIELGIKRCLKKLHIESEDTIFLDGSLKAPSIFKNQTTIIRGDEKVPVISLASVMAKVHRDRYMKKLSKKYPLYGFEINKGYGTLKHRQVIAACGISPAHRQSFVKKYISVSRID